MFQRYKFLLIVAASALVAAACGHHDSGDNAVPAVPGPTTSSPATPQTSPTPPRTAASSPTSGSLVSGSYEFHGITCNNNLANYHCDSCTTGPQRFSGKSQTDYLAQYCAGLENDALNNSCAESTRMQEFKNRCPNLTWQPLYAPGHSQLPQNSSDFFDISDKINFSVAAKVTINPSLKSQQLKSAQTLADEITHCGIGFQGPLCDSALSIGDDFDNLQSIDQTTYFVQIFRSPSFTQQIGFFYKVDQSRSPIQISELEIRAIVRPLPTQGLSGWYHDPNSYLQLLTVSLEPDAVTAGLARLASAKSLKDLSQWSFNLSISASLDNAQVALWHSNLTKQLGLLLTDNTPAEQVKLLKSINSFKLLSKFDSATEKILLALQTSKDNDVRAEAADIAITAGAAADAFRKGALVGLTSKQISIREDSLDAVSIFHLEPAEVNQVLLRLGDENYDVEQKASDAISLSMQVSAANLPTLETLAKSSQVQTREDITPILERIGTDQAADQLLALVKDENYDVEMKAVESLSRLKLSAAALSNVEPLFQATIVQARLSAADILAKYPSDSTTAILIRHLNDENFDVEQKISEALRGRALKVQNVAALEPLMHVTNVTVREDAAGLLGKIDDPRATTALLTHLDDDNFDVQQKVDELVSVRKLDDTDIPMLVSKFSSTNVACREDVAHLLGKIGSPAARKALKDRLPHEDNFDVKQAIEEALGG